MSISIYIYIDIDISVYAFIKIKEWTARCVKCLSEKNREGSKKSPTDRDNRTAAVAATRATAAAGRCLLDSSSRKVSPREQQQGGVSSYRE